MTKITDRQIDYIVNLYLLFGRNIKEIIISSGLSRNTIFYYLKKRKAFFKTNIKKNEIKDEYELNNDQYIKVIRKSKSYSDHQKIKMITKYKMAAKGNFDEVDY